MPWSDAGEQGADHPVTIADLFTGLTRANFRVDTIAEPEPARRRPQPVVEAGHELAAGDARGAGPESRYLAGAAVGDAGGVEQPAADPAIDLWPPSSTAGLDHVAGPRPTTAASS